MTWRPPVKCPVPGHDRGPWLWVPYLITLALAILATIGGFIPWEVATPILTVAAVIGLGVSYYHVLCHRAPHRFKGYEEKE